MICHLPITVTFLCWDRLPNFFLCDDQTTPEQCTNDMSQLSSVKKMHKLGALCYKLTANSYVTNSALSRSKCSASGNFSTAEMLFPCIWPLCIIRKHSTLLNWHLISTLTSRLLLIQNYDTPSLSLSQSFRFDTVVGGAKSTQKIYERFTGSL